MLHNHQTYTCAVGLASACTVATHYLHRFHCSRYYNAFTLQYYISLYPFYFVQKELRRSNNAHHLPH